MLLLSSSSLFCVACVCVRLRVLVLGLALAAVTVVLFVDMLCARALGALDRQLFPCVVNFSPSMPLHGNLGHHSLCARPPAEDENG